MTMHHAALFRVGMVRRPSGSVGGALLGRLFCGPLLAAVVIVSQGCAGGSAPVRDQCAPSPKDAIEVTDAVNAFYGALQTDDLQRVLNLTTPDFFAYDGGVRWTAASMAKYLSEAHSRGVRFDWNLADFQTHVSCAGAWTAYRNTGGIAEGDHYTALIWFESAALARVDGQWRVQFLHSSRSKETP
jgi:hypothetical protein